MPYPVIQVTLKMSPTLMGPDGDTFALVIVGAEQAEGVRNYMKRYILGVSIWLYLYGCSIHLMRDEVL